MQQLRKHGDDLLSAQRAGASLAARPAVTDAQRAQQLARAMVDALDAGRKEDARRMAIELRPLLGLLEN